MIVLAMLLYTRSHHQNRFQKLFAIYFKFRGLSAKGFDTVHALALIMSHKWACDLVSRISQRAIMEAHFLKDRHPWLLSYDNVNIPFRVFSQRIDKQSDIGAGSAATIYIKRNAMHLPPSANRDLQETWLQGMKNPLSPLNIFDLATQSYPRIQAEMKYQVLQFFSQLPTV